MKNLTLTIALIFSGLCSEAQSLNFEWAWQAGAHNIIGNSSTIGLACGVDGAGNVYTTGNFSDTVDFDPGPVNDERASSGGADIFISKTDVNGNYLWTKKIGSASSEYTWAISVNASGEIWLMGVFSGSVDFDPDSTGNSILTSFGDDDIFILKLDNNGNYQWVKQFGGTLKDLSYSFYRDGNDNLYMTGTFKGTIDLDPSASSFNLTSNGNGDVFFVKLNSSGNFLWGKSMGGQGVDTGEVIRTDALGNVYTAGIVVLTVDLDPGPGVNIISLPNYGVATFINKTDPLGNQIWTKCFLPNSTFNGANISSMDLDANGNIYSTGHYFNTIDFNPDSLAQNTISSVNGTWDIFICKLDSSGAFQWVKSIGANDNDEGQTIHADNDGDIYVSGDYAGSLDFDPDSTITNSLTAINGYGNYFLKFSDNGILLWATNLAGVPIIKNFSFIDNYKNIYITGQFGGTIDVDPGSGVVNISSTPGTGSVYVVKLSQPTVAGLNDFSASERLMLYPNPAGNSLQIQSSQILDHAELIIRNMQGQIIFQENNLNGNQIQVALNDFSDGMYLIEITNAGEKMVGKLLKQ